MKKDWRLAAWATIGLAACASTTPPAETPTGSAQDSAATGSVTSPLKPLPAVAGRWTADRIPAGSKIAIAIGQFEPKLTVQETDSSGSSSGTQAGLEAGKLGILCGPAIIVCMPLFMVAGAVVGGAVGAAKSASREEAAANAKTKMEAASRSLLMAGLLEAQVESQLTGGEILRSIGPTSADETPHYVTGDYIVEIAVTDVIAAAPANVNAKMPYRFVVTARGRLIRVADNAVVDTFTKHIATVAKAVNEWTAADNIALHSELKTVTTQMVETFLDEWVLVYRGEPRSVQKNPPESETARRTPTYVLRPVEPQLIKQQGGGFDCAGFALNCLQAIRVPDLTPKLSWERLPRDISDGLFAGPTPRAKNLSYEVQIFRSERLARWAASPPTSLASAHNGIKDVEVKVELEPCKTYFWTVRARFELDGRQRATEWSGAYLQTMHGDIDPGPVRRRSFDPRAGIRSQVARTQKYYYFPIETPCGRELQELRKAQTPKPRAVELPNEEADPTSGSK